MQSAFNNTTDDKISYRKLEISDLELLIEYRIRFLQEIQQSQNKETINELENYLRDYFSRKIPSDEFIGFVAEKSGKPVGFGGMVIQENPGHFRLPQGKQGYILNMYTLPEARGLGICQELLSLLQETARQLDVHRLTLLATDMGINIYRSFGFKNPLWTYLEKDI